MIQAKAWGTSSRCFLMCGWAGFSQITLKPSVFLFHCESALKRCSLSFDAATQTSWYEPSEPWIPPFFHNTGVTPAPVNFITFCHAPVTHSGCRTDRSSQQDRNKLRWRGHSSRRLDTNTSPGSPVHRNPEDTLRHTHTDVKTAC